MSIERPQPLVLANGIMNQAEGEIVEANYNHNNARRLALSIPVDHQSLYRFVRADAFSDKFYSNNPDLKGVPPLFDWDLVDAEGNRFGDAFDSVNEDALLIVNVFLNPRDEGWSFLTDRSETVIEQAPWADGIQFSPSHWDDRRTGSLEYAEQTVNKLGRISLLEIPGVSLIDEELTPGRLEQEIGYCATNDNSYVFLAIPSGEKSTVLLPYLKALYGRSHHKKYHGWLSKTGFGVSGVTPDTESLDELLNQHPDLSIAFQKDPSDGSQYEISEYVKRCFEVIDEAV